MGIVLCDEGFEGLLTGVYWALKGQGNQLCVKDAYRPNLIDSHQYFEADDAIAQRMQRRIEDRFGSDVLEKLYWASLSEDPNVGGVFIGFFKSAVNLRGNVLEAAFVDETMFEMVRLSRQVGREYHRMRGLTRFTETSPGVYYGLIEPLYNILTPLSQHFAERLNDQKWILHDKRRQKAVFYGINQMWESPLIYPLSEKLQGNDAFIDYWRTYYQAIAIEERVNEKRRQGFMPKRYWANLPEMTP